jgi:hypothetical protein
LWEAFLLQMNDFDLLLEVNLRRMLDPVVAAPPPVRRGKARKTPRPVLAVEAAPLEFAAETIPVVEPVVVAVPHLVS